jgi:hypothetical protein
MMQDVLPMPRTETHLRFVPVIFANGEDDDCPGLEAAFTNKEVLFDDRTYRPGEDIVIHRRKLALSKGFSIIAHNYKIDFTHANRDEILIIEPEEGFGRAMTITDCEIFPLRKSAA